jgi:hypothetical protein
MSSACVDPISVEASCAAAGGSRDDRAAGSRSSLPSAVAVFAQTSDAWARCSGVLVGPRAALTAAHCVHDRHDWMMDVFFSGDLLSGSPSIEVESTREHPTRDLALLVLDEIAPIDVEPLRWSGDELVPKHRDRLSITGYGGPDGDLSQCLRVTEGVRDISLDPFRADSTRWTALLDGISYPGDSGGPLVLDDGDPILLGISVGKTSGEVTQGSLSFVERLPLNDPWVVEAMESPPIEID